jgi:exodeoxyribonuclease-3
LRVATWNVNGIRARFGEVNAWAEREQPDVLCLQEIRASAQQVPEPLTGLPGYTSYWHGAPGGYAGVSLHVHRRFHAAPRFSVPAFDVGCRIVEAAIGDLAVASVYVPNGNKDLEEKMTFLRGMRAWVAERLARGPLLVCGDLNVARTPADVTPKQRKASTIGQTPAERELFEAMLGEGVRDVVRELRPDDTELFTWWPPWRDEKKKNHGWRIDYVLASAGFEASGFSVHKEWGTSDHAPVLVELASGQEGGSQ